MKRILFLMLLMFSLTSIASADEMQVNALTIGQGQVAQLEVALNNPDMDYAGFQFLLTLPEGISVVQDENNAYLIEKGDRLSTLNVSIDMTEIGNNTFQVLAYQVKTAAFPGTSGVIAKITLSASGELAVGAKLAGSLTGIQVSDTESNSYDLDDVPFTITIGEPADTRTILDETSTTAPEASDGAVDVRVKRTITAGNWNTICLPFAMTTAQLKDVFGNDVQLADFVDYDTEEDTEENTIGITVNFETAAAIEANHPYIIKVSEAVTEFTVDGVEISPEDDPCVEYDNGKTGKKREVYGRFVGTFVADFDFYNDAKNYPLFLNGNKFYYATDNSKHMKAFRAYFDFVDYLAEAEGTEVKLCVDGFETRVEGLQMKDAAGTIFDLSGRRVSKPAQRGLYIVNGKKALIK